MKSLDNYISESIYGNLGIDTAIDNQRIIDWVNLYNSQGPIKRVLEHFGAKADLNNHTVILPYFVNFYNDKLFDNGYLPSDINFVINVDYTGYNIEICSKKLKSLKGISVKYNLNTNFYNASISIHNAPALEDISDALVCDGKTDVTLLLHKDTAFKSLNGLADFSKKHILNLTVGDLSTSTVKILDKIKNCTFNVINLFGDLFNNEIDLYNFFKNNVIKNNDNDLHGLLNIHHIKLADFDFLKGCNKESSIKMITWPIDPAKNGITMEDIVDAYSLLEYIPMVKSVEFEQATAYGPKDILNRTGMKIFKSKLEATINKTFDSSKFYY